MCADLLTALYGGLGAQMGTRLNFLNMVAFPITFGIGVEYAVDFCRRSVLDHDDHRVRLALRVREPRYLSRSDRR